MRMATPPENVKLTNLLRTSGASGAARRRVMELLKRSRLLLEVLSESDLSVLATRDEEGLIVVPVFSCVDEARASPSLAATMTIAVVPAAEIFRRALSTGVSYILVNPASCRWRLSRPEIEALALGSMPVVTASNTLESRIEKEIAAYKSRTGDLMGSRYLNNFYGHLPGGFYRRIDVIGLNRPYTNPGAGKRRKEMSFAQFHELIDRLIVELDVDLTKIKRLHEGHNDDAFQNILPLYVRLRNEGFKHYPDLTA